MLKVDEQAIGDRAEQLERELDDSIQAQDAKEASRVMTYYRDFRLSASEYHKDLGLVLVLEQHFSILKDKFLKAFGYEWSG